MSELKCDPNKFYNNYNRVSVTSCKVLLEIEEGKFTITVNSPQLQTTRRLV